MNHCMLTLFVVGLVFRTTTAITCYKCSSTTGKDNVESTPSGCAQVVSGTGLTTTADGTVACMTKYTKTDGFLAISRDVSAFPLTGVAKPYCTDDGSSTTCYCITSNCNAEKVAAPTTYDCYSCTSSHYFDNGCGATLTAGSQYVTVAKGCSSCYKSVTINGDNTITYTRGCAHSINIDATCPETVGDSRQCACTGSLCNSAQGLKSVSVAAAIILSVIAKIASQ